ncbi:MAG: hypothetical protein HKN37_05775 [Rhodothermales bacterium]|nr:hypothetical protein [Rhodothermales bacterium]
MQNQTQAPAGAVDESSSDQSARFRHTTANVSRWAARSISLVVLTIWGFFIAAHLISGLTGGGEEASRPLQPDDYVGLGAMGAWLIGLMLGWRWEPVGGTIVIMAFVISATMNTNVLSLPFLVIPTAGILFTVSWWIRRMISDAPPIPTA